MDLRAVVARAKAAGMSEFERTLRPDEELPDDAGPRCQCCLRLEASADALVGHLWFYHGDVERVMQTARGWSRSRRGLGWSPGIVSCRRTRFRKRCQRQWVWVCYGRSFQARVSLLSWW